jgi:Thrombospondin type 3 repeat
MKRRFILLAPLLALFAFVATTEERAVAADVATRAEGENFAIKPAGYKDVSGAGYSEGAALKFTQNNTASHTINCSATCDVVLMASGGQSGGQPTFSVNGLPAQALRSTAVMAYTFDVNLPAGQRTINVTAGNTGTGRNAVLDVVTFPASDGGGTDTDGDGVPEPPDNCPNVYNPGQYDRDGDGIGNKCDDGSIPPTDTDNDGVIDAEDQCDTQPGPAPTGCPTDPGGGASWNCTGNQITPGEDLDAIINNDASGTATRFCVHAGTYRVSAPAILKAGDKLDGEPGTKTYVDTATKPTPVVKLEGSGTANLLRANGTGISVSWVDLSGASGTGTGSGALTAGSAGSDFLVQFARIHDNASLGISNMRGRVLDSEFFSNSKATSSLGFNGSAVKGITEFEAGRVYVHNEQGNGLWCDVGCSNDPARANGFWVYDSVVLDSNRAGIRYENSPNQALFENNEVHGNGKTERRGGIDIRDSQNARVINNNLGPATIAGVSYLANGDRIGVRATDSGRSDRVNLWNVDVVNNKMNGDSIVTCGGQVACSGNTNVGIR